jgi:hypothetical protein
MGLDDASFLVDHVGDALRVFVFRRTRGSIRDTDRAIGVAEQRKREAELFREAGVVGDIVETRAEDGRVLRFVLVDEVPEPGTLFRSARSIGLWIEPEHDLAAAQVVQRNRAPVVIRDLEVRSFVANVQHASSSQRLHSKAYLAGYRHATIVAAMGIRPRVSN